MRPTVYIVQEPVRRDRNTGELVPAFDLTPAAAYGDLKVMLPTGNVALSPDPLRARLTHELRNFTDDDFLLPTGSMAAATLAAAIAAKFNRGRYKLLQWDRKAGAYIMLAMKV